MITSNTVIIVAKASFVVSTIFFFFSVIQLIKKNKPLSNYFLSVVYFAVGIQCLSFWLYFRESPLFEKYFYYSDTAFLFLIGSFLYLFFLYITSETQITFKIILLNTASFIAALLFIEGINLYYPSLEDKKGLLIINLISMLSYVSLFIYLILILRKLKFCYTKKSRSIEIGFLIYIIICSLVFTFFLLLSSTLLPGLQLIGHIAFFFISFSFIFFLIRYPDYFINAQKESQEIRYHNSQLKSIDKEKAIARLDMLMEEVKIYRESTLSLKTLSDKLNISFPQLSELLNSHYKANFNSYINSYRIEEVKIILKENSEVSILEIAFDCGFNSKATFNSAFRKFAGMTPTEYKNKVFYK